MGARRLLLLLLVAACSAKPAAPPPVSAKPTPTPTPPAPAPTPSPTPIPTVPDAPVTRVTLAEVGLEAASLDRSVDPCVDFYQFACGGWLQATQIPPDRARWARFSEIDEKNKLAIKGLLEDDAKGIGADAAAKKLGDYYASCMDEAAIEKTGTTSIKPLLDKVQKVKDPKSWFTAISELHKAGIPVVWATYAEADLKDSTKNVTSLESSGLGLPDRDYYVDAKFKDKVDAYKQHVTRMLTLAGVGKPDVAAADVIAIETELAKLTKTAVEKRDPQAAYNPTDLKGLAKQSKIVDWKAYFKALGFTPSAKIIVGTPKYLAGLDGVRKKLKPPQWASYFTYHLLVGMSFALPKAFDDEAFELKKTLTGVTEKQTRYKRCIDSTTAALGELLGRQYSDKYFPPAAKQTASALVDAIIKVMHDELGKLDWMSEPTKRIAQDKLGKVVGMIGYPDKWRTYDFDVKREDFAGNELRAAAFETRRIWQKSGKPVDRSEWLMNTFTVNAYYQPTANNTALPAGILQPPFFGGERSVAANLGGIGMVIGHELTHGFDDQGAQFDAAGNLKNWWDKTDKEKFDAKGMCVATMYESFEAQPKAFVNGKLTLGENIADLGGVKMAFKAYRSLRKDVERKQLADGFTEDQQFFLAVGQAWCSKDRPQEIQRRLTVDPHAPPKFRVYGALRNLPEFSQAFSCAAGTPMQPAQTCSVW